MPIYEFRCRQCDGTREERRDLARLDAPPPVCPDGHGEMRRVLSLFATASSGSEASPAGGCGPGCACAARG